MLGKETKQDEGERSQEGRMLRGRRHSVRKVTSEQRPRGSKPENTHLERLFQAPGTEGAMALRWAEVGSVKSGRGAGARDEGSAVGSEGGEVMCSVLVRPFKPTGLTLLQEATPTLLTGTWHYGFCQMNDGK